MTDNIESQTFETKAAALQFLRGVGGYETFEHEGRWCIRLTKIARDRADKTRKEK